MRKPNFPEWISFFRIVTFPVLIILLILVDRALYGCTYVILFSTDSLDGFVAWLLEMIQTGGD